MKDKTTPKVLSSRHQSTRQRKKTVQFTGFTIKLKLIAASIFIFSSALAGTVNQDGDVQLWLYQSFNTKLNDKLKLYADGEIRYGDDASTLYLYYFQTRLLYSICNNLELGPGYRQQYVLRPANRMWVDVYEPFLDITLKFKLKKWEFTDRNRVAYRFVEDLRDFWLYRNRLMVISPWKLGRIELNPRGFYEIFLLQHIGYFESRIGIGAMVPFKKKGKVSFYYLKRYIFLADSWRRQNILWVQSDWAF